MKKIVVFVIVAIGFVTLVSFGINQNQVPYFSTKLSPYSGFSLMNSMKMETVVKLETGFEDSLQVHLGTGKHDGNIQIYWMMIESSVYTGRSVAAMDMSKKTDEFLKICRDTIKHKFRGDSTMIAFEMIHHLSTDEVQYIWLDGNNNRSEKAIIISLNHPLKEGNTFPDLTVEKLNEEQLSFNDLIGKTVIINWWATWCGPCIAEIPGFNILVEKYKQNSNVVFIAIANEKKERVTRFLEDKEFNYIQTLANEEALKIFGDAYPRNVIVNSAGKICHYSTGGSPDKYLEIERILEKIL